jgi:hypothetical protein
MFGEFRTISKGGDHQTRAGRENNNGRPNNIDKYSDKGNRCRAQDLFFNYAICFQI